MLYKPQSAVFLIGKRVGVDRVAQKVCKLAAAYIGNGPLQRVKRSLNGALGLVLFFGLSWKPVSQFWLQLFPFFTPS